MESAPAGAYWLGPLLASFGVAAVVIVGAIALIAWVADVTPGAVVDALRNLVTGGDQ